MSTDTITADSDPETTVTVPRFALRVVVQAAARAADGHQNRATISRAIAEVNAARGAAPTPAPVIVATALRTTNDTSGNPRRGWLVRQVTPGRTYGDGVCAFVRDHVAKADALGDAFPGAVVVCSVDVTPGEFRDHSKRPATFDD